MILAEIEPPPHPPCSTYERAFVARELAPAGLRSGPRLFTVAAQPSGSKLPRHNGVLHITCGD
ncbi:hypothetical protein B1219_10470 [Pseudomonas ogarae]|nr:hypothetical protein B1219_10470 [Pseudomonas ogarae]